MMFACAVAERRLERDARAVMSDGLYIVLQPVVTHAQIEMGFRQVRLKLDDFQQYGNRHSEFLLTDDRGGQVSPGRDLGWVLQNDFAKVLLGHIELAACVMRQRELVELGDRPLSFEAPFQELQKHLLFPVHR